MKKDNKSGGKKVGRQGLTVNVYTARDRSKSSAKWLRRQLNDPYVEQAKKDGYRSRAAYKLLEMDERFHLFKPHMHIVDLGAAPGSWCQVVVDKIGAKGTVVAIDLLDIKPIGGVHFIQGDFTDDETYAQLQALVTSPIDVVMSDMAANAIGHTATDHIRIMALCEMALDFAITVLKPDGTFLCKVLQGGTEKELLTLMKKHFTSVKHVKPKASRADSAESYVLAQGFRRE